MRHLTSLLILVSGGILARPFFITSPAPAPVAAVAPAATPTAGATPAWGISRLNEGAYNGTRGVSGGPTYVSGGPTYVYSDPVYVSSPVYVTNSPVYVRTGPVIVRTPPVYVRSAPTAGTYCSDRVSRPASTTSSASVPRPLTRTVRTGTGLDSTH